MSKLRYRDGEALKILIDQIVVPECIKEPKDIEQHIKTSTKFLIECFTLWEIEDLEQFGRGKDGVGSDYKSS